jgi:type I restriction enzyme S subunit
MNGQRKMVDSGVEWMGEIPEWWRVAQLKNISTVQVGKTPNTAQSEYFDGGLPWITIGDLDDQGTFPQETTKTLSHAGALSCGIKKAPKGSLLVSFKLSIGKVAIAQSAVFTNEAVAAVMSPEHLGFLRWSLPVSMNEETTENIYGAKIFNQGQLGRVKIPLPPLPIQVAIANHLDQETSLIDTERSLIERKVDLLRAKRQALIFECVTGKRTIIEAQYLAGDGGDRMAAAVGHGQWVAVPTPKHDDPFVKTGRLIESGVEWIGEIPEGWLVGRLSEALTLVAGKAINATDLDLCPSEERPFAVWGSNGIRGYADRYSHEGSKWLVGRQGCLAGAVNRATGRFWPSEHALVANENPSCNHGFIGFAMHIANFMQYSGGAAQPGLAASFLARIAMPFPPLPLQATIAAFLDHETALLDREVDLLEQKLALLSDKRKAIIFEAVTGKREVIA